VTEANRIANAREELTRAEECLREARTLQAAGLAFGAVSRAYYAVFHAVRALLFSAGLEVKSHRGAVSLLGEHFVKTGRISVELGRTVAHLQRDREDADYAAGAVFTQAQAAQMITDAEYVLRDAERVLST
jgi:hypothetical protein